MRLDDAIRNARQATCGSPWTGQLDKHEVSAAVERLICAAEELQHENDQLRARAEHERKARR